jgi:hypothetical protein
VPADAVEPCAVAVVGAAEVDVFVDIAGATAVDEPFAGVGMPAAGEDPAETVST